MTRPAKTLVARQKVFYTSLKTGIDGFSIYPTARWDFS